MSALVTSELSACAAGRRGERDGYGGGADQGGEAPGHFASGAGPPASAWATAE